MFKNFFVGDGTQIESDKPQKWKSGKHHNMNNRSLKFSNTFCEFHKRFKKN